MRYFIEITRTGSDYTASIHQGNPVVASSPRTLAIGPDVVVSPGQSVCLGQVVDAFVDKHTPALALIHEERSQLDLGHYLYRQLFGELHPNQFYRPEDDRVDLRIITDDEYISRLPWNLLAHHGIFLSATGWSVSLAQRCQVPDCTLPPSPRMLVIAPEPEDGWPRTHAASHLETLEHQLSRYDHHLALGSNIQVVTTWEQFRQQLRTFEPQLVYYYGHGIGNRHHSRLLFADNTHNRPVEKPMADVAQCLRALDVPPRIVYLNCYSGDAGGFLGAGWQLGAFIPAVVTNRTATYENAARAQALAFWQSVLVDSLPPHRAMAEMHGKLLDLDLSFSDARWMTPVIYCHYNDWTATPPRRLDPLEHDPHWHLKLDRVGQFATVTFQTRQMLRERRPRALAYTWYGEPGQGIELFHKRLRVELQQDLASETHFLEVQPEWPMDYFDPDRSFADMLCEAFNVHELRDIPRSIRNTTRGASGRLTLVYVRHQPVRSKHVMDPQLLKRYLEWWDRTFVPLLGDHTYALLTVSFEVNNPPRFRRAMLEQAKLYDLELSRAIFRLLDEMERIGLKDLFDFLQTHNIRLPRTHKDRILQNILEQTSGHYEQTVSALRRLVEHALDMSEELETPDSTTEEEFDY